jgi:phage repressor protein C with HTH and peptisase S24 domain
MKKDSRRLPLADWQKEDSARLKAIFQEKRTALKLTQEKIASELGEGVTQGAVSHFMNQRTALSIRAATVFARMLNVPVSDFSPTLAGQIEAMASTLDTGKPNPRTWGCEAANTPLPDESDLEERFDERYEFIPQFTAHAAAGPGHDNAHVEIHSTLAFKKAWIKGRGLQADNLKVIYAAGSSMWPTISDRDVLLVDISRIEPADGEVFVIESQVDGTLVKRLSATPIGGWVLRSDNIDKDEHPDRYYLRSESNEHRIVGKVVWRGGDL